MLTVTTRGVPSWEQQSFWEATLRDLYFAVDGRAPCGGRDGFRGRMDRLSFGGLRLDRVVAEPYRVIRSTRAARCAPGEMLLIFVLRRGHVVMTQDGRSAVLRSPRDLAVVDTTRGYGAELRTPSELTMIQMPRSWAGSELPRLAGQTAITVPGRSGLAGLAVSTLLALRGHVVDREDAVARCAAANATRLATAAVLERSSELAGGPPGILLVRAQQFMLDNLSDPDLAPADVAAVIPISERHLYSVFRDAGSSPAEWLRQARLERAKSLLVPSLERESLTIGQVAQAVGLPRASHFSRLFRERFGMSPRDFRSTTAEVATGSERSGSRSADPAAVPGDAPHPRRAR